MPAAVGSSTSCLPRTLVPQPQDWLPRLVTSGSSSSTGRALSLGRRWFIILLVCYRGPLWARVPRLPARARNHREVHAARRLAGSSRWSRDDRAMVPPRSRARAPTVLGGLLIFFLLEWTGRCVSPVWPRPRGLHRPGPWDTPSPSTSQSLRGSLRMWPLTTLQAPASDLAKLQVGQWCLPVGE